MASPAAKVNRRRFLRRAGKLVAGSCVGAGLYAWGVEPHWVEVVQRKMPLAGLPVNWQGKRLVQISDLHIGPVVSESYLRATLGQVASLEHDLIVVTGDWMTSHGDEQVPRVMDVFSELETDAPIYGVLGNHDYGIHFKDRIAADRLALGLSDLGVRMLRNESLVNDGLQIAGLDELWAGNCKVERTVDGLDNDLPTIMLCHNPDGVDRPGWQGYQGWILSGHTHGGQCRIPGIGAPIAPIDNRRYVAGEVEITPGRRLYVNRAIGYKHRVRFLTRPEITVFTLSAAS